MLGTAAALVCLLIVAGALLRFGSGGDDATPATTVAGGNPSILPTGPATPSGLSAIRTAAGGVLVAWQAPEEPGSVARYQVQRKDGDGGAGSVVETPDGETLSVTFPEIDATNAACFTVIAIGVDNALSDESRLVCA